MRASHCNDVASDSVALETSARLEGYYPTVITGKIGKRAVLQPDIRTVGREITGISAFV